MWPGANEFVGLSSQHFEIGNSKLLRSTCIHCIVCGPLSDSFDQPWPLLSVMHRLRAGSLDGLANHFPFHERTRHDDALCQDPVRFCYHRHSECGDRDYSQSLGMLLEPVSTRCPGTSSVSRLFT